MKFARLLLIALLAIVVLFQGTAAVGAGQCMALGHHQGAMDHDDPGHAHDGQDGQDHAAPFHADEAPAKAAAGGEGEGAGSHCGPCAACCASASIAGPAGLSIPPSHFHAPYSFAQLPPLGVQPDGVDRPPLAL